MCAEHSRHAVRQRGVSIVEVMVGMVVAIIVGLAATGSARIFTSSQRQGVGVGSTSVAATTALSAIKGDIASAGLGFFGSPATTGTSVFKCYTLDLSVNATMKFDGASFAPVRVSSLSTNADQLDVMFSNNIDGGAGVLLKGSSTGDSATLMSLLPAQVGDAVLLAPATPGNACLVRTVTSITASTETTPQVLTFANSGTYNQVAFTSTPSFAERDSVALLGTLHWSRYRLSGTSLLLDRPLDGTSATLLRNVLAFRVQYGTTGAAASNTLTGWQTAAASSAWAAASGSTMDQIRALRIGVVQRSAQREKENSAGTCEASSAKPTLFGNTVEPDVTDWQCYRYRSSVLVVPLRNLTW